MIYITDVSDFGKYELVSTDITEKTFFWSKTTQHQFLRTKNTYSEWKNYPDGTRVDIMFQHYLGEALDAYKVRAAINRELDIQLSV